MVESTSSYSSRWQQDDAPSQNTRPDTYKDQDSESSEDDQDF